VDQPVANDTVPLTPRTDVAGPTLAFDLPGLLVGVAEYDEGPTGCTVFLFPRAAAVAIDPRGGAVGILGEGYPVTNAICLAGGSLLGLEAATGVAAEIFAQRDYKTGWADLPLVCGAIVYDFGRESSVYPDKALGRAAARTAKEGVFPLGPRGAGRSATVGKFYTKGEPSGQGGAFTTVGDARLAVFTVVNAVGAVVDRDGSVVRGNRDPETGERRTPLALVRRHLAGRTGPAPQPGANTTLTVLVTDLAINGHALRQLAREVHSSMSRAIQPFHTATDGDVLFAVSTGALPDDSHLAEGALGVLASELAWDAVLAAVTSDVDQ
jgi:L-aminopeptidase/D-esterase-like protein